MVLSARERTELHEAVVAYLEAHGLAASAATVKADLASLGDANLIRDRDTGLERKWNTIRRLNLRVVELEATVKRLQSEVVELSDPTRARQSDKSRDLLPVEPCIATLAGHRDTLTCVVLHPYENVCLTGSEDGTVRVWDVGGQHTLINTLRHHSGAIADIALDPVEGKFVASASTDQTVKINDWSSGECVRTLHGHETGVTCVAWLRGVDAADLSSGGSSLARDVSQSPTSPSAVVAPRTLPALVSASRDGELRIWDAERGALRQTVATRTQLIRCLAVNGHGTGVIAFAGNDQSVSVYNIFTKTNQWTLDGHSNSVQCVAFSNPAADDIINEHHGTPELKAFVRERQRKIAAVGGDVGPVVSTGPTSHLFLASGGRDKNIRIFDVVFGKQIACLEDHENWVRGIAFANNGKHLISCSDDGTLRVFDLVRMKPKAKIVAHDHFVTCLSIHPQSKPIMVTGSADRTIRFWSCK